MTGAHVRYVGQLEEALHSSVFAVRAMQGRKDHGVAAKQWSRLGLGEFAGLGMYGHGNFGAGRHQLEQARIAGGIEQRLVGLDSPAPLFVDADEERVEAIAVEGEKDIAG